MDRAQEFLLSKLSAGTWPPGTALPSLRSLAASGGFSLGSMHRALSRLKDDGILSGHPRFGYHSAKDTSGAAPTGPFIQVPPGPFLPKKNEASDCSDGRLKWERLRVRVERDILMGRFLRGRASATMQEMQLRYDAGYRTLRKALGALVSEGLIAEGRSGYQPTLQGHRRRLAWIGLLGEADTHGRLDINSERRQDFLRHLERECAHRNLGLRLIGISNPPPGRQELDGMMGAIVWGAHKDSIRLAAQEVLAIQGRTRTKPAAFLDEMDRLTPGHFDSKTRIRIYPLDSTEAALHLGRHLTQLGHRRLAFISPYHKLDWSKARLEGLRQGFGAAGGSVLPIVLERDHLASTWLPGGTDTKEFKGFKEFATPAMSVHQLQEILNLAGYQGIMAWELKRQIEGASLRFSLASQLGPLLKEAAAEPDIDAWVMANDNIAGYAAEFLRRNSRVRRPAVLAGFDDSHLASTLGLTSVSFNLGGIVNQMLTFLTGPTQPLKAPVRIQVQSLVVDRETHWERPFTLQ